MAPAPTAPSTPPPDPVPVTPATGPGLVAGLDRWLARASPLTCAALALVVLFLVTAADYATGSELSSSVFYVAPIALAAWYAGRRWALSLALVAAVAWYMADALIGVRYSRLWIGFWNAGVRLAFFVIIADLLARLKGAFEFQRALATTDLLTGLANARRFLEVLEVEANRAVRYDRPLTVACLDLDDFKGVNDAFGHAEGNRVLEEVGRCLATNLRATDVAGRLGGDEFAILLPETSADQAREAVSKLETAFAEEVTKRWPVGVSIGVVTRRSGSWTGSELLRAADDLMYEMKRGGKGTSRYRQVGG